MIPENVTLVVKAPNQQIDDQNIECQSSWTIKQLKGHLAQVYPNKPRTEEQKIIYSGQLLEDAAILKDVLRVYDDQPTHTMHLVCAPRRKDQARAPETSNEGLRRRIEPTATPTAAAEPLPRAETSQNQQNHSVEMENYLNSAINNYGRVPPYPNYNLAQQVPQNAANQMMMMQQAYMQYMQQYALWQASVRGEAPAPLAPAAPAPAPEPPAEDEELHRDWLDHLYAASRLAILSSLIYLYGSGARLLLVIILAVAGYLHQIGFFRELNINRNLQGNQNQPAGNRNQPANQNANQPNPPDQNGNPPNQNGNPPNQNGNQPTQNGNQVETEQPADDQRSLWSVTWMIFSTFFASLIPEANQ